MMSFLVSEKNSHGTEPTSSSPSLQFHLPPLLIWQSFGVIFYLRKLFFEVIFKTPPKTDSRVSQKWQFLSCVDVSEICSGRGKGDSKAPGGGGGVRFFLENQKGVGGLQERGRGAGRVSVANRGI